MKDKIESKLMNFSDENIKDDESTDETENIRYTADNGSVSERIHVESTSYRNLNNLTINKEVRFTDQDLKGSTILFLDTSHSVPDISGCIIIVCSKVPILFLDTSSAFFISVCSKKPQNHKIFKSC
jgi:hypothetical protein